MDRRVAAVETHRTSDYDPGTAGTVRPEKSTTSPAVKSRLLGLNRPTGEIASTSRVGWFSPTLDADTLRDYLTEKLAVTRRKIESARSRVVGKHCGWERGGGARVIKVRPQLEEWLENTADGNEGVGHWRKAG
ncbi:unnamed protein product [Boreogadus saida]